MPSKLSKFLQHILQESKLLPIWLQVQWQNQKATLNPQTFHQNCTLKDIFWEYFEQSIFKLKNYNKEFINNCFSMLSSRSDLLYLFGNNTHTFLNTLFVSDCNFTNSLDTFFNELWINLVNILFKFFQNWLVVLVVDNTSQYFYFLVFDIVWIWKLWEETLDFVLKNWWSLFDYVLDVF